MEHLEIDRLDRKIRGSISLPRLKSLTLIGIREFTTPLPGISIPGSCLVKVNAWDLGMAENMADLEKQRLPDNYLGILASS